MSTNPTTSPRRHLVQALTLVNDIINRRKRDGVTLSDEELELLGKAYKNAPRPSTSSFSVESPLTRKTGGASFGESNPDEASSGGVHITASESRNVSPGMPNNNDHSTPGAGGSGGRKRQTVKDQVSQLLPSTGEVKDVSSLVSFAVSCSALTTSPVQLMQLLVDFVTKLVPRGKPVSMMIFDGDYTVDPLNGTLLANSARFLNLFADANNANDFVFDATAAAYFIPVVADDEIFGFVQIANMHAEGEMDSENAKILIACTCIAALALRTSWQLEDLEWSHRKQNLLLKIGNSLTSDAFSKENDVFSRIQLKAKDLGDAHGAYYFRVDEETREIKYFNKGELIPESAVFAGTKGASSSQQQQHNDSITLSTPLNGAAGGSATRGFNSVTESPIALNGTARAGGGFDSFHHGHVHSVFAPDGDDGDDEESSFTDAVRLAMQTAERVVKTAGVVQLQQAPGDDDAYVDVVGSRSRYAGAKKAGSNTTNNSNSNNTSNNNTTGGDQIATAASQINLRRGNRAVNVDLPFSLIKTRSVRSVLGIPVLNEENQVKGVIVLTNKNHRRVARIDVPQVFEQRDVEIILSLASVASIAIANCKAANRLQTEKRRRDAVLSVVAHLNETDIRNVTEICKYVMHGARKLVNADRSTLFLIDEERDELYSAVADSVGKVIRFPVGKGIAGRVALTGQAEIIRDAYQDDRFNKEVDKETGYRTLSILTVPVQSKGNTLAVAQLVNKLDNKTNTPVPFSQEDLEMLRTFSLFAGIAISNSQLLEFTVKAGQEAMALTNFDADNGALPLLKRQMTATSMQMAQNMPSIAPSEVEHVKDALDVIRRLRDAEPNKFDPTSINFDMFALRDEAPDAAIARDYASAVIVYLFQTAGFDRVFKFDQEMLVHFVLQCRAMYRFVPYHNFFHACDVTQTIYTFLYSGGGRAYVSELEAFVLLVTGLVHDLDHMGLNNSYHLKSDSPLGILSSVSGNNSVLEVHHCNLAIQILAAPDCGILSNLPRKDQTNAYRELLSCVLATDMARHGDLLQQFVDVCTAGFNKDKDEHRLLAMQIITKAADISNVVKPFHISRQWAAAVTEEFYQQGDKERAKGLQVLPMNDRQLGTELAKGQIGFINFVAKRFFTTIHSSLFKEMSWAIERLNGNVSQWEEILKKHQEDQAKENLQS